jgi:hypothetical protein
MNDYVWRNVMNNALLTESAEVLPERQTMGRFLVVVDSHLGSNFSSIQANTASGAAVVGALNIANFQAVGNYSGAGISVSQS